MKERKELLTWVSENDEGEMTPDSHTTRIKQPKKKEGKKK